MKILKINAKIKMCQTTIKTIINKPDFFRFFFMCECDKIQQKTTNVLREKKLTETFRVPTKQ